jgi:hypothetical protein
VLARLKNHPQFKTADLNCDDCCPECVNNGPYSGNPATDGAWWAGQEGPGAEEFMGFLVRSMKLESSASARRRGEPGEDDLEFLPRTLEIEGRLLGNSHAATYFGETELLKLLTQTCGNCDFELSILPFCPEESEPETVLEDWEPGPLPDLVDTEAGCGPCDRLDPDYKPPTLSSPLYDPWDIDTGKRNLMRARFRSLDDSDEQEDNPMPYCHGKSIRLVFEIVNDYEWGDGVAGCTVPLASTEFDRCRPPNWDKCFLSTPAVGCSDPERETVGSDLETFRPAQVKDTASCYPLYRHVDACLTPPLLTTGQIGLGFDFWSGGSELRNVSVEIYKAFHNWPSPASCEGEQLYNNHKPCATLEIDYVPPTSTLSIDPRREQVVVNCPGAAEQRAEEFTNGWDFPVLDFSCRYWIKVTADCFNTAEDAELSIVYWPRWAS